MDLKKPKVCNVCKFWKLKRFTILTILLYLIIIFMINLSFNGCAKNPEPEPVVKYKYIDKPTPKLQTIKINELNLSKEKPLTLHIKVLSK